MAKMKDLFMIRRELVDKFGIYTKDWAMVNVEYAGDLLVKEGYQAENILRYVFKWPEIADSYGAIIDSRKKEKTWRNKSEYNEWTELD